MASAFLQMVVVVELRTPPERLHGSVTGVEAGQSLTLSNVWFLDRQTWQPQVIVDPSNIVDIFDASKASGLPLAPASTSASVSASVSASAQPTSATPAYEDPAILSFKIGAVRPDSGPGRGSRPPSKTHSAMSAGTGSGAGAGGLNISSLSQSVQSLHIDGSLDTAGASDTAKVGPKAVRLEESQRQRRKIRNTPATDTPVEGQTKQAGRGKGWRETPMLQDTASFQPFRALKKSGRRRQQPNQDSGWASEDVTDVQEMGDFDFEGGLAKFDKRTLFDQMRRDDQIADADRLVTHNRRPLPKPGTAGGKNLHHTENVLDLPPSAAAAAVAAAAATAATVPASASASASALPKTVIKEPQTVSQDFWNSEADDVGAVRDASEGGRSNERGLGSRQSSRRGESKVSTTRRSQPRKASASAAAGQAVGRSSAAVARMAHGAAYLERNPSQASLSSSSSRGFCLLPSRRRIETVSALQILNLENIAHNELGLTQDMMTENAGRGIAEVALTALADPAVTLRIRAASTSSSAARPNVPPPTVVVLAGNNKSGTRAIAGARHLRNRGVNVLVCVVGIERGERELLEDFRQQVRLYRNFGGRIYGKSELFEYLRKTTIPTLTIDTPRSAVVAKPPAVSLVIDALLGLTVSFDELRTGDQATVYELIEWANRNEAFVLAVDLPTGIDPTSGKISIIDGARLFIRPRYVVAMGAPKRGLLEAVSVGETEDGSSAESAVLDDPAVDWRLFIADIGLGAAVWKKAGTKIRRGIDFEDRWVLELKYIGAAAKEEAS